MISAAALLSIYNGILNVLWSAIAFAPLSIFCYRFMELRFLYAAGTVSLLCLLVPTSWLRLVELSSRTVYYRRLGVHMVNRFTQHGSFAKNLVRKLVRSQEPEFHALRRGLRKSELVGATYMRERFHWSMLLFFLFAALYAVAHNMLIWAFTISVTNVIYNLYPIWLQQYIRLRLIRLRC